VLTCTVSRKSSGWLRQDSRRTNPPSTHSHFRPCQVLHRGWRLLADFLPATAHLPNHNHFPYSRPSLCNHMWGDGCPKGRACRLSRVLLFPTALRSVISDLPIHNTSLHCTNLQTPQVDCQNRICQWKAPIFCILQLASTCCTVRSSPQSDQSRKHLGKPYAAAFHPILHRNQYLPHPSKIPLLGCIP